MKAHPTHLYALLFNDRKLDQLAAALAQTRARLDAEGELDLWFYWDGMRMAAQGLFQEATEISSQLRSELKTALQHTIAVEKARQTGDWHGLAEHCEARWKETKSAADLLAVCEAKLHADELAFVIEHADEVIASVGTPEALRIAATAAGRHGAWRKCLSLLDTHSRLFPMGQLPSEMRRLRVACEQNLGMLSEALRDAEALASDENSLTNQTLLFDLRVRTGKLQEAVKTAQTIIANPETPAATLVQVGWIVRLEDRILSQAALQKAVVQGIDDPQQVGVATMLAHELEMPGIVSALMPKFAAAAQQADSGVKALDLQSTVQMINARVEQQHGMLKRFATGAVPVHVASELLKMPLAIWPVLNAAGRTHYAPGAVFFRHGGKPWESKSRRTFARVYVDVTAFIVAHELGLLPLIETMASALVIPRALRTSLVQQLDSLSRGGIGDDANRSEVLQLIRDGKIEEWNDHGVTGSEAAWREGMRVEWSNMVEEAGRRSALMIDYWPKPRDDGSAWLPPPEIMPRLSHAAAIVTGLEQMGLLSDSSVRTATEQLAGISTAVPTNIPAANQSILLTAGIAQRLAQLHVLSAAAGAFHLVVSSTDIESLREAEKNQRDRDFVGARLRVMISHLNASTAFQDLVLKEGVPPLGSHSSSDAASYCLAELLQAEVGKNHWVWSDDRWLNGHQHVANLPVISTAEILGELHRRKLLSAAEYYTMRHRMRLCDFRYFHPTANELWFWLQQTTAEQDGMLVENAQLYALRQYWARCLSETETLQFPPVPDGVPNPQGEAEFFTGGVRAMHDTFVTIFNDTVANEELLLARATWLLYWMWCPAEHLAAILGKPLNADSFGRLSGSGEGLFFARMMDAKSFTRDGALERLGHWLGNRLYDEPSRLVAMRRHLERTMEQLAAKVEKETLADQAHCVVLNRWYFSFPEWLRENFVLSAKTRRRLKIGSRSVVSVGGEQFESDKFWQAAEAAFASRPASVTTIGSKTEFAFTLEKKPSGLVVILQRKSDQVKWGFEDAALGLLDAKKTRRLNLLVKHPEWFGLRADALRKEAESIAGLRTMQERISALDKWRAKSVWASYRNLAEKCAHQHAPTLEEMVVGSMADYLFYLGCEGHEAGTGPADWEKAGQVLLETVGLEETLLRLGHLPTPMPESVIGAFEKLPSARSRELLRKLKSKARSPLLRAQWFRLGFRKTSAEVALEEADLITDENFAETGALLHVVRWTWNQLGAEANTISAAMRLAIAWVHAGQLFEILRGISKTGQVADFFSKHEKQMHAEVLVPAKGEDDVAFPRNLSAEVLWVTAIGSVIATYPAVAAQLSKESLKKLESLCVMGKDAVDLPKLEWLYDPAAFTNLLGSFIGLPREQILAPFVSQRVATFIGSGELARQVEALVGSVEEDTSNGNAWIMLGSVMRGRACPAPLKTRLGALMRTMKFAALPATEALRTATVLALGAQAAEIGGDELMTIWQDRIAELAGWLGRLDGNDEDKEKRRQMVIRCALTLARHGPVTNPVKCFSDTIVKCWAAWTGLAPALRGMLPLLLGLPHSQLASAWSLVFRIRNDCPQFAEMDSSNQHN